MLEPNGNLKNPPLGMQVNFSYQSQPGGYQSGRGSYQSGGGNYQSASGNDESTFFFPVTAELITPKLINSTINYLLQSITRLAEGLTKHRSGPIGWILHSHPTSKSRMVELSSTVPTKLTL